MIKGRCFLDALLLLCMPTVAFASSGLALLPILNLIALAMVLVLVIGLRISLDFSALALFGALLACGLFWITPSRWIPGEPWFGLFAMAMAFFPPLIVGFAIAWFSPLDKARRKKR